MEREMSQDLKDKLEIIEKETDFFSRKPEPPAYSRSTRWAAVVLCFVYAYFALTSEDKAIWFLLLLLLAVNITSYFREKQHYDMYSRAIEIIKFYKESDTR